MKETASIHVVRLEAADDFDGWRDRARGCLMAGLAPDRVVWMEPDGAGDLFASDQPLPPARAVRLARRALPTRAARLP